MISWFALMVWLGGLPVAYQRCRELGRGRLSSAGDAIMWPYGVGTWIATHAFDPGEEPPHDRPC